MIKTALIGFGLSGRVFHAPLITTNQKFNLKYILSSRAEEIKKLYPAISCTNSYDEILKSDIELVVITTPNELHYSQVKEALLAGKHVIVEKPFVIESSQGIELEKLAKENNLTLSVYHNRRYDGDFKTIKSLINNDDLGVISVFESHFDRHRPQGDTQKWREQDRPGSGVLFDLGSHLIDQMLNLFGKPDSVLADIESQRDSTDADDYFHLVFNYKKMRVILHSSSIGPKSNLRFKIQGSKGSYLKYELDPQENALKNGSTSLDKNWGIEDSSLNGRLYGVETEKVIKTLPGSYQDFYINIADCILNQAANPVTSSDATLVIKVIECCFISSKERKSMDID